MADQNASRPTALADNAVPTAESSTRRLLCFPFFNVTRKGVIAMLGSFGTTSRNIEHRFLALIKRFFLQIVLIVVAILATVTLLMIWLLSSFRAEVGARAFSAGDQIDMVGTIAPEIEARDLSGEQMTLSEFRGKVVMLVFWYSACGPCIGEVPHERELVERFAGRPFALVGVNTDDSIARALDASQRHSMSWRSFWDGGPGGPIACLWGVRAFPKVFLIDDLGTVLHADLRGQELDAPLEQMIAAAEARGHMDEGQLVQPDT